MDPGGGESNVTSEGGEGDGVTEALVLAQLVASSTNLILIFVYWTYLLYASISRCVQTPLWKLSFNLMQSNQPKDKRSDLMILMLFSGCRICVVCDAL